MNQKKIRISLIAIVLLIMGFAVAYVTNLSIIDSILPDATQKTRKLNRARSYFPESIGTYTLFGEPESQVQVNQTCNKIEDNPILKKTGRTGDACIETIVAEYRESSKSVNAIVRINLSSFTKESELLTLLVKESTTPDMLNGYPVFRLVSAGIGWFPASRFDFIVAREGTSIVSTSSVTTKYSEVSTGNNEVTAYFISKYTPKNIGI